MCVCVCVLRDRRSLSRSPRTRPRENVSSVYRDRHASARDTYILEPGELVHLRICPHYALEVHVVALFDIVRIQGLAHPQADHRLVLYVEPPLVLQRTVGQGGIFRAARQIFTVVLYGWHETEDTQTLIVLEHVL